MMHSVQSLLEFFLSCPSKIKKFLAILSFLSNGPAKKQAEKQ